MNENDAYIFAVESPTDWNALPGRCEISGWFHSKVGAVFHDVRAIVDGVPRLGVWGLPRPELAARWPERGPAALFCGFRFPLELAARTQLVRLEILDAGWNWVEFWRVPVRVRPDAAGPAPRRTLNAALLPGLLVRLLQRDLEPATPTAPTATAPAVPRTPDARREPGELARQLVRAAATPGFELLPAPPFYGWVDEPALIAVTRYQKLYVRGWLFHEQQAVRRLFATTGRLRFNDLGTGQLRPDALAAYPQFPQAGTAQFTGLVDLEEAAPDPAGLRIWAELADGSVHLVFARRFHQLPVNTDDRPLPPYSAGRLLAALRAVRTACREEAVTLPPLKELWPAVREARTLFRRRAPAAAGPRSWERLDPYSLWVRRSEPSPRLTAVLAADGRQVAANGPLFSLIVEADGADPGHLTALARSVQAQSYPRWELLYVLRGEPAPALRTTCTRLAAADTRFRLVQAEAAATRADALNAALAAAGGDFCAFPEASGRLPAHTLLPVAERAATAPRPDLLYTDEDVWDAAGRRRAPDFKAAWNPTLLLSGAFPGHLTFLRRSRVLNYGGFRSEFDACPHYDLMLRLTETLPGLRCAHVPHLGYHARATLLERAAATPVMMEFAAKALDESLRRRGLRATAVWPDWAARRRLPLLQLRWDPALLAGYRVTIVIPTRDRIDLLQRCIQNLELTVDWRQADLIIVDDFSRDAKTVRFLARLAARTDLRCRVVQPEDWRQPFNYSRLVNLGTRLATTPLVVHLNNDVDCLYAGWLEEMAGWFSIPDVGVVGAKQLHADDTLNHAGVVVGVHGGLADGPFVGLPSSDTEFLTWHQLARDTTAVTGACLMTRRELYSEVDGFDETNFGVAYNDIDFCLKVLARGQRVVLTPQARAVHWGSASRGEVFSEDEHLAFLRSHGRLRDRHFNPHWQIAGPRLTVNGARGEWLERGPRVPHILLVTHNLNYEGAPLFLAELARWLRLHENWTVSLLSCEEGPLRKVFQGLGVTVTLVDRHRLAAAESTAMYRERLGEVIARLDLSNVDLVAGNTLNSWWAVHLAELAGLPAALFIHESTTVERFFRHALHPHMQWIVPDAFRRATRVNFLCAATRRYYDALNTADAFRTNPGWVDVDEIDTFKQNNGRESVRARLGLAPDETVIVNIGTVCERKGQHTFVYAVEDYLRHHARGRPHRFLLVGGHGDFYEGLLRHDMERLALSRVEIVPKTDDAYAYYRAADLCVCTSFEESFPRVLLEAMAFEVPFVTTDVHGIPEIAAHDSEGILIPPGDAPLLSHMMKRALDKSETENSTVPMAYSRVLRYFDVAKVLPRYVSLLRETYLAGPRNLPWPVVAAPQPKAPKSAAK